MDKKNIQRKVEQYSHMLEKIKDGEKKYRVKSVSNPRP